MRHNIIVILLFISFLFQFYPLWKVEQTLLSLYNPLSLTSGNELREKVDCREKRNTLLIPKAPNGTGVACVSQNTRTRITPFFDRYPNIILMSFYHLLLYLRPKIGSSISPIQTLNRPMLKSILLYF